MTNKDIKSYSTSLVIRETHIKTIMRYYITPQRMATIKNQKISVHKDVEQLEYQCW